MYFTGHASRVIYATQVIHDRVNSKESVLHLAIVVSSFFQDTLFYTLSQIQVDGKADMLARTVRQSGIFKTSGIHLTTHNS